MSQTSGQWALITGASSGLGMEFACSLASRKCNLVLTARREEPMQVLAAELRQKNGVEIVVEPADLGDPASPAELQTRLDERGIQPDILINNAGFGWPGSL